MIRRIVRMEFDPRYVSDFLNLFGEVEEKIRAFPGCEFLELCKDPENEHILFTYSHWENQDALESYRHSKLFEETWEKTKKLFGGRPLAYSLLKA